MDGHQSREEKLGLTTPALEAAGCLLVVHERGSRLQFYRDFRQIRPFSSPPPI
jgi:hypothetical protein